MVVSQFCIPDSGGACFSIPRTTPGSVTPETRSLLHPAGLMLRIYSSERTWSRISKKNRFMGSTEARSKLARVSLRDTWEGVGTADRECCLPGEPTRDPEPRVSVRGWALFKHLLYTKIPDTQKQLRCLVQRI